MLRPHRKTARRKRTRSTQLGLALVVILYAATYLKGGQATADAQAPALRFHARKLSGENARSIAQAVEGTVTSADMPVEGDSAAKGKPDTAEEAIQENQPEEALHERIIRHDMLLQRDDLQKYMQ
ncbi:hypothetical protein WJX84_007053, partial [Apatococcus fuscideae]